MDPQFSETRKRLAILLTLFFVSILLFASAKRDEFAAISRAITPGLREAPEDAALRVLPPQPDVAAEAYLVRLIGDENLLLARRADKALPPASITKLLTALVAQKELGRDERIEISASAKAVGEKESSAPIGEVFRRDQALGLALIESANDAAAALAEAAGRRRGGFSAEQRLKIFRVLLAEQAGRIGLESSRFLNPTGIAEEGHRATAGDLAKFLEYLWQNEQELLRLTRTIEAAVRSEQGREYVLKNTNELLKEFPAILASKTGTVDEKTGTIAMLYPVKPGKIAIVVILGSPDKFTDGRNIIRWLERAFP